MAAKFSSILLAGALSSVPFMTVADNSVNTKKTLRPANATTPTNPSTQAIWQKLSAEERAELLKSYQSLRQLGDKDREDLQQRMEWFSQLPKEQQSRMREVWQNMSETEREHWKTQLRTASPQQRDELREQIMQKYD